MHCTHIRVAASFLGKVGEDATTKHAIHSELEIDSTPAARKKERKEEKTLENAVAIEYRLVG